MAYASDAPLSTRLARFVPAGWSQIRDRFALELRYRDTLDQLERLTDRDLADMGLHRSSLPELAWEEAERQHRATPAAGDSSPAPTSLRAFAPFTLR